MSGTASNAIIAVCCHYVSVSTACANRVGRGGADTYIGDGVSRHGGLSAARAKSVVDLTRTRLIVRLVLTISICLSVDITGTILSGRRQTLNPHDDKGKLVGRILSIADRLFRELLPTVPQDVLSLDITMPQFKILLVLYVGGSTRMSDIASRLDVTLPTATSLVDRLVEKHYVAREDDPDDRRVVLCHLSEQGEAALGRIWHLARARCHELLEAMDLSKLEMLADALQSMYDVAVTEQAAANR